MLKKGSREMTIFELVSIHKTVGTYLPLLMEPVLRNTQEKDQGLLAKQLKLTAKSVLQNKVRHSRML